MGGLASRQACRAVVVEDQPPQVGAEGPKRRHRGLFTAMGETHRQVGNEAMIDLVDQQHHSRHRPAVGHCDDAVDAADVGDGEGHVVGAKDQQVLLGTSGYLSPRCE